MPEKVLWKALRKPDLGFRRQVPIGRYIVDFVHLRGRLVVELDGGWHDLPEAELHDALRDAWLNTQGYRVIRFRMEENKLSAEVKVAPVAVAAPTSEPVSQASSEG